jgi:hypothetical protein
MTAEVKVKACLAEAPKKHESEGGGLGIRD